MKTLLYLVDFSQVSRYGCKYAFHLAHDLNASLVLLHVVAPKIHIIDKANTDEYELKRVETENLKSIMRQVRKATELEDLKVECVVEVGKFISTVKKIIEKVNCDLLLISTKGHGYLSEKFLGSHTTKVLKKVKRVPTLVIPSNYDYKAPQKIACAVEMKKSGILREPIKHLVTFAENFNSEILFVYVDTQLAVKTKPQLFVGFDTYMVLPPAIGKEEKKKIKEKQALEMANEMQKITDYQKKKYCVMSNSTDVFKALKALIKHKQIDMIVMVRQKRGFFERFVHDSVSTKMSMSPEIPILIFHEYALL